MADVPVTFVNSVLVSGFLNGIVNLSFSTAQFIPDGDGKVKPAEILTANLRMDLYCAQQIHDSLANILEQQTKPAAKDVN
jgi:hypothetical protein